MLIKPDLKDEKIVRCLQAAYGLTIEKVVFLPLGADFNTEIKELRVRIYQQDQLMAMLQSAEFKHIRTIKAFDQSSTLANQDEFIVYACKK